MSEAQQDDPWAAFPIVGSGEQEPQTDSFDEFPVVESSKRTDIAGATEAFSQGFQGGVLETGPIIPGMVMGARIGALAGPVGMGVGAAVGAGAGYLAGKGLRDATVGRPSDLPQEQRPFAVAGEVFGSGLPFAGAPLAAARAGYRLPATKVGNFLNKIIDTAARSPASFARAEMSGLSGAATLGGAAEAYFPGEAVPRLAGEVVGGFFNPFRLVTVTSRAATGAARRAMETMSPAGRETAAGRVLKEILDEAGEDPQLLARILRESGLPGVKETAAQKSGSPALAALEAKLRSDSAKFGAEVERQTAESLEAIEGMIGTLRGTGDPQALRAAAELRDRYFRTLLEARVRSAESEAVQAAGRITTDTPGARSDLSRAASEAAETSLRDARAVETELWERIPGNLPSRGRSFIETLDNIRARLLDPDSQIPAPVRNFVNREIRDPSSGEERGLQVGRLLVARRDMLQLTREAAAAGRLNDAEIYGELAEAALQDIAATPGIPRQLVDEARAFSRALHDTFTRTFAGKAGAVSETGARVIAPEIMLRRALAAGGEATALRMQELEQATRFLARQGVTSPQTEQSVAVMVDAQERMLRLAAADAIDPNTGRVNPTRLGKFVRDNEQLFNRFPEARRSIEEAVTSELRVRDLERVATGASRVIDQQAAFAKVAKVENPVDAVNAVVRGNRPQRDLEGLVKLAKRGGPEAMEGLKASAFDYVMRRSGAEFDPAKLRAALFDPIRPGAQQSFAEVMQASGVFSADDVERVGMLIDRSEKILNAARAGQGLDELIREPDALFDLVLRYAGAQMGGAASGGAAAGAPLVIAGAGSRYMRQVFAKVPGVRIRDVLIEAARDPNFMALLLEKVPDEQSAITVGRQIHAYLFSAGLTEDSESQEPRQ